LETLHALRPRRQVVQVTHRIAGHLISSNHIVSTHYPIIGRCSLSIFKILYPPNPKPGWHTVIVPSPENRHWLRVLESAHHKWFVPLWLSVFLDLLLLLLSSDSHRQIVLESSKSSTQCKPEYKNLPYVIFRLSRKEWV
jgi:hypothetical protein